MPKKVPLISVTVFRDSKPVALPVGKPFDFTEDEVSEIEAMMPGGLRDPIVEVPSASTSTPAATKSATPVAKKAAKDDGL